jgi:hypothetical protein
MTANSRNRPLSPLTESSRCSLIIKGLTIHAPHYTESIRDASALPELHGYLRQKYQWTQEDARDINWTWFTSAARTYQHNDNHLIKLVHDQLPTRYIKHKESGQSWIPATCRFCEIEPETFEHLLKCNHCAGNDFRKRLPRAVREYCQRRGAPSNFQSTLVIAIEDWLQDKTPLQHLRHRPEVHSMAMLSPASAGPGSSKDT